MPQHWLDTYPDAWKDRAGKAVEATMYVPMDDLRPNMLVDTLRENKALRERVFGLEKMAEFWRTLAVNVYVHDGLYGTPAWERAIDDIKRALEIERKTAEDQKSQEG